MTKNATTVRIELLEDSYECDTCGYSYSQGGRIFINGECLYDFEPVASCYGGSSLGEDDLYKKAFEILGVTLEVEYK